MLWRGSMQQICSICALPARSAHFLVTVTVTSWDQFSHERLVVGLIERRDTDVAIFSANRIESAIVLSTHARLRFGAPGGSRDVSMRVAAAVSVVRPHVSARW